MVRGILGGGLFVTDFVVSGLSMSGDVAPGVVCVVVCLSLLGVIPTTNYLAGRLFPGESSGAPESFDVHQA